MSKNKVLDLLYIAGTVAIMVLYTKVIYTVGFNEGLKQDTNKTIFIGD